MLAGDARRPGWVHLLVHAPGRNGLGLMAVHLMQILLGEDDAADARLIEAT